VHKSGIVEKGLVRAARAGDALGGDEEEEPAPQEVFRPGEGEGVAETLWSRLRCSIGVSAPDL
jgi:hypothetical protein